MKIFTKSISKEAASTTGLIKGFQISNFKHFTFYLFGIFFILFNLEVHGQFQSGFKACASNNNTNPPYTVAQSTDPNYTVKQQGNRVPIFIELATAVIGPGDDFCIGNDPGADTQDGCGTFLFTGLDGSQSECETQICFSPRQGCGSALGNVCIFIEDPLSPGNWLKLGAPDGSLQNNEVCVYAPAGVTEFAVTICRPGNGPVSIFDVVVNQPPTPDLGPDKTVCTDDLPATINLTLNEPNNQSGGSWTDSNGPIADPTAVEIDGNLGDEFTFTYTYDASGDVGFTCTVSDDIIYTITDVCCEFVANCPANTHLGDYNCNQLQSIPAPPTNEAEAEAAPYNMTIGDIPCGVIVVQSSDDITNYDVCVSGGQTITRTVTVFDDLNADGILNGAEESQVCTFTFEILEDTTPPSIDVAASDLTEECASSDINAWLTSNGGASASDLCGTVTWSNDFTALSDGCGNTGSATVTFTATDECGLTNTTTATYTIVDTTPPSIDVAASDLTEECASSDINAWLTSNGGASASDLCGTVTWSNDFTALSDGCGNTGSATVTFTATDECGLTNTTTATYTIVDTTPPSIDVAASDLTEECASSDINAWLTSNGGASASDLCGTVTWSNDFTALSDGCGNTGSATVTFTATDECGLTNTTTATYTIVDTTPPSIDVAASDLTEECASSDINAWLTSNGGASASDLCGTVTWSNDFTALSDGCGNTGSATVTFTATDECGLTNTTTATYTIVDTTPPSIDVAASDLTEECASSDINAWLTSNGGASASDLCGTVTWSNDFTALSDGCGNTGSATVTFTATDECGLTNTTTATYTIVDTTPPSIDVAASDLTEECASSDINAWLTSNGGASASDLCGTVTWSNDFTALSDGCGNTGSATVTFTATDECGLTNTTTATYTIVDTTPPSIDVAASDLTEECASSDINAWLTSNGGASASDLCGTVTWSNDFTALSDGCGNTGSATVTFTATDECGLTNTTTATYTIVDTTPPSIDVAASDLTEECASSDINAWLTSNGGASASDLCGTVTWSNDFTALSDGCGNTGSATVTFTATDECGLTNTTTATYTIVDTTPPSIDVAASDLTEECASSDINAWLTSNGGASASDLCGTVTWSNDFTALSDGCGNTGSATVTFTATDECGLTNTTTATYTIVDTTPPSIDVAASDLTEECASSDINAWLTSNGGASASDLCGTVTWSNDFTALSDGCGNTGSATVTFTATDECGLTNTTTATYTIVDTTPPSIDVAASDLTEECASSDINAWLTSNGGASASDLCGTVTWSNDFTALSDGCGNTGSATVTFTATDECGLTNTTTATYTIVDTTPPSIDVAASDLTEECASSDINAWLTSNGGASASDLCGTVTWSNDFTALSDGCGNTGSATVTFTATDECGLTNTTTATYTIVDTTPPSIDVAASDLTEECASSDINAWLTSNGGASASDLCGTVTWSNDFTALSDGCGNTGSATVTFTATDECGLTNTTTATYTIVDTTPPSIDVAASDLTEECASSDINAWLTSNGGASASDLCGTVTWSNDFTALSDGCGNTGSATVTFTATDECGLTNTTTATYTIVDTTPPSIDVAASDLTEECASSDINAWLTSNGGASASDLCGTVTWSNDFTALSDGCGNTGSATVTFTATDECGLTNTTTATYTIVDTTPPSIDVAASDLTEECASSDINAWLTSNGGASASDLCGTVTWSNDFTALSDGCGNTGSATVTFTATDECGLTNTTTATYTIVDTTPPSIDVAASDLTEECASSDINAWLTSNGGASASDLCGTVTWSNDFTALSDGCGNTGSATVTFTATDECGLTNTTTATYTIVDTTPPSIDVVASDLTEECASSDINAWLTSNGGASASDLCGTVTWSNDFTALSDGCGNTGSATVTFTATDECGLTNTTTATYTIVDTTPPSIDVAASDLTEECASSDINAWLTSNGGASASDLCGTVTWSNDFTALSDGCGNTGSATVTFTATDECGLTNTTTATYTIVDTTPPSIDVAASDLTEECASSDINAWLTSNGGASASDLCGTVTWSNDFTALSDGCGNTGSATVTFTATDECGLTNTTTATYTIVDTTPPSIDVAASDLTEECASSDINAWLTSNGGASASDLCGTVTWSNDFTALSDGCGNTGSATVTFTATDECGLTNTTTATYTIVDTTPPSIDVAASDLTEECASSDINAWLTSNGGASASDLCGTVTWSNDFTALSDGCGNTGSATVTFTATDECGLTNTTTATYTIVDTTPPSIDVAASDLTEECASSDINAWLTSNGGASASDLCGTVTWSNDFTALSDGCGNTGSATVTFTATDECGLTNTTTATYTIVDTTPPSIDVAASDLTEECASSDINAWLTSNGGASASDLCGTVTWSNDFTALSDGCGNTGSATVTFTATDECGLTNTTTATYTIVDTTPPSIDVAASDLTEECASSDINAWLTSNGGASASDLCGTVTWSNDFTALSDGCGNTGSATVTFTATDECGLTNTTTATYTIVDTTPPSIDVAASDLTEECASSDINAWLTSNGGASASDLCGTVTWSNDFTALSDGCGNTGSATVTFTATDECGLTNTTTATYTIVDTTPPSIDVAASDLTEECASSDINAWLTSNGGASASDLCGTVTWSNDFTALSDGCGNTGSATVTFTATDECGLTNTTTATYTIVDTTPPSIDVAASDLTEECASSDINAWLTSNGGASASDLCGTVTWSNDFTALSDGCGNTGSATVTFTATDECGLTNTTTATYTIEDTTPPGITCPADITIECTASTDPSNTGAATSTDTCDASPTVTYTDSGSGSCSTGEYVITRTWTAIDDCGNEVSCTQLITVAPATVSGHIYDDTNGNGTQDAGEPDLVNIDVVITDSQGNTQTVTTDANGNYSATVPAGTTTADVDETDLDYPTGYTQTEGDDPTTITAIFNQNNDIGTDGYFLPGSLNGHLYVDTNGNGTQDLGEPDLADLDVLITDANGNTQTVTTDANGDWIANNLPPGTTSSDVDESDPGYPTEYTQTEGDDPTSTIVVAGDNTFAGNDGYDPASDVSGHLYVDTNGNGTQDAGEPDLANVDVIVTDASGIPQTVTTDANGDWTAVVLPGEVTADVDENDADYPTGYTQTEGEDPTVVTAVANADTDAGNDGYDPASDVSGHLYVDTNGNGVQDAGEPDLANVDVLVTDSSGNTQTVTTDANGDWTAVVLPGEVTADVDENDADYPTGYTQTEGEDPTVVTAVANADTDAGNDGYDPASDVSGHLYVDTNGNGTQDAGEPDLANVDVIVTDVSGIPQTVTTDANGDWTAIVLPGSVTVDVDDETLPTGSPLAVLVQTEGDDPTTVTALINTNNDGGTDGYNRQADVSIVKTDNGSDAVAGEQYEYTLNVSNGGPWDANGIVVVDNLPEGMSFVSANGANFTVAGQVITSDPFDIIVGGADVVITITVDVASSVANGTLINTATANGIETDPDPTNNEDDEPTDVVREADLSISKDDGVTQVTAGDGNTYTYIITVDNIGPSDADNVLVSEDSFPAGFTMGTVTPSQGTSTAFPYNLGTIVSGGQATIEVEYTVPSDTQAGDQTNIVSVTSDEPDPNPTNNEDSDTNEVLTSADLSITKNDDVTAVTAGDGVTYTYTITMNNAGPSDADLVSVSDTWPAGFTQGTVTPSQGTTTAAGSDFTWSAGTIVSGGNATLTVSYTVPSNTQAGFETNTVTVTSDEPDPNTDNNTDNDANEVLTSADLSISKDDGVTQVTAGDGVTYIYTITVDNIGPSDADNVIVSEDSFPAGFTMGTVTPSQGTSTAFPYNLGTIASGKSATITVQYTVPSNTQAGFETNTVTVSSDEPDPDTTNNEDSDTNEVLTDINLSIVKTFDEMEVPQGTYQSFTLEVSNAGPSDAVDVTVIDLVDSSLDVTGVNVTIGTGNCVISDTYPDPGAQGETVDCTVNVPAGESATITVDYITAPFFDASGSPYDTELGDDFYFVSVNGDVLEGSTDTGVVLLNGEPADALFIRGLSRNDIIFDPDGEGPEPAFELHLSCSDPFTGGWGQSGGPVEGVDDWQIAYFSIGRYSPQGFLKSCGNVLVPFVIPNVADATGEDSEGVETVESNIAEVTIGPGITLDRLSTNGKRLTARLNNLTGDYKKIDEVYIVWPDVSNGELTKVWLNYGKDNVIVWEGNESGPEATLIPIGNTLPKLLEGEAILRFDFKNKVANTGYTIQVHFTDGTWLDINVPSEPGSTATSKMTEDSKVVEESKVMEPFVAEEETKMVIYPNPATTTFNINLEGYSGEFAEILLFDLNGRQLLRVKEKYTPGRPLQINLPYGLNEGLYYVKLNDGSSMLSQPIIIKKE